MPWIPDAFKDELLSRTSIEEIVNQYVPLKRAGRNFVGLCPFHNEKSPSFSVNVAGQFYHCFGCGASGDAIRFVQEMEHLDFPEAIRFLAERANMQVPEGVGPGGGRASGSAKDKERFYEANVTAARFFHSVLWTPEGAEMLDYLYRRGLNDSDIRRFGLGAAPNDGNAFLRHMREQGFTDDLLLKVGLMSEWEGRRYAMFRGRVIFPIIDARGKVIGFGGRVMGKADERKYINSPQTPIFDKSKGLYAMNFVRNERDLGRLVLVEGYMDTVSLRKNGVRGVVATLGTSLTEGHAMLIKRYTSEVWISYDGDHAGQKAALRALDIFDGVEGLTARVIDYPAGQDPDDFVRANGLEGFEKLPRHEGTEYRMIRARDDLDLSTEDGRTLYAQRCCEILRKVKDPIRQENYLRKLSQQTGYEKDVLQRQIGVLAEKTGPAPRRGLSGRPGGGKRAQDVPPEERALLTLLAQDRIPRETVKVEDFSREISRRIAQWLLDGQKFSSILSQIEDDTGREEAVRAVGYEPIPEGRDDCLQLAQTCLASIRKGRLNARMEAMEEEIRTANAERKAELYRQMIEIKQALNED